MRLHPGTSAPPARSSNHQRNMASGIEKLRGKKLWYQTGASKQTSAVCVPMGLARQASDTPASDHTLGTATLGDGNGVNHLVGLEHTVHSHSLWGEQGRRRTCTAQNTVSTWRSGCQSSRWPGTHCPQSQPDNMEKGRGITQEVTSGVILACLWLPLCLLAVLRGYYRGGWLLQYCNQDKLPVP